MNQKRKLLRLVAAAALALPVSVCMAQGKTGTVKIGLNEPLSGALVSAGIPAATGVRLAVKDINDKGGFRVGGTTYRIRLIEVDNKSQTVDAVAGMTKLVEDDKVKFVFGPTVSVFASQAQELSVPAKVMHFSPASSWQTAGLLAPGGKTPLLMGTQMAIDAVSNIDVEGMRQLGVKKLAFVSQDDETAKGNIGPFLEAMKAAGISVVQILYPPKTTDFSSVVSRAKGENVEGIYFLYPQAQAADLLRAIVELKIPIKAFGGRVIDPNLAVKTAIGGPLPFAFYATLNTPSMDYPGTPKIKAFADRAKAFEPKLVGSAAANFVFYSHDFVHMLVEAMKRAGTVEDTAKIAQAYTSMTYDGVAGKICYNNKNIRTATLDGGIVYVRGGKIEAKSFPSSCK